MQVLQVNTTLNINKIKIDPEYQSLVPSLKNKEYKALRDSVERDGLYEPIIINTAYVILDGHHRFKACKEVNVLPRFSIRRFEDKNKERRFVIESNFYRRQLNKFQKAEIGIKLEKIYAEEAKQRLSEAGKLGVEIREGRVGSNEPTLKGLGKANDLAARAVGLSPTTYHRAKTIISTGSEELKQKVRNGSISITYAYKKVIRQEKHSSPPELPKGKFDVIYADPPWEYYLPLRGDPEFHYSIMPTDKICDLEVPSVDNAILFLWVTNPKLEDALRVIKAWGFTYKTNLVWVKDKIGTGYYFRGQHELLLVATKGNIPPPIETNRPSSVLVSSREEHSKKPDVVAEFIEFMYPNRQYLELFARNHREGWTCWGDEVNG